MKKLAKGNETAEGLLFLRFKGLCLVSLTTGQSVTCIDALSNPVIIDVICHYHYG